MVAALAALQIDALFGCERSAASLAACVAEFCDAMIAITLLVRVCGNFIPDVIPFLLKTCSLPNFLKRLLETKAVMLSYAEKPDEFPASKV